MASPYSRPAEGAETAVKHRQTSVKAKPPRHSPAPLLSLGKRNRKFEVAVRAGQDWPGRISALRFCGKRKLQFIVSKRHPEADRDHGSFGADYPKHEDR